MSERESLWTFRRTNLDGWRLAAYYVVISPWSFERRDNIKGRRGWILHVKQPNGGHASIPARTRIGAWRRLLSNPNGMGYWLA